MMKLIHENCISAEPIDPLNVFHKEMTYNEFGEMGMALYNVVFLIEIILVMGHLVPMILVAAEKV